MIFFLNAVLWNFILIKESWTKCTTIPSKY